MFTFTHNALQVRIVSRTADVQRLADDRHSQPLRGDPLDDWIYVRYPFWLKILYPLNRKRQQMALQSGWIVRARAFQGRR